MPKTITIEINEQQGNLLIQALDEHFKGLTKASMAMQIVASIQNGFRQKDEGSEAKE